MLRVEETMDTSDVEDRAPSCNVVRFGIEVLAPEHKCLVGSLDCTNSSLSVNGEA